MCVYRNLFARSSFHELAQSTPFSLSYLQNLKKRECRAMKIFRTKNCVQSKKVYDDTLKIVNKNWLGHTAARVYIKQCIQI